MYTVGATTESGSLTSTYNHPDGRKEIIRKISPVNTKRGAEQYEAQLRQEMLKRDSLPQETPPAPRFREYAESFMSEYARVENKPSEVISKERILKNHLYPVFARKPLDRITRDDIKAYRSKKERILPLNHAVIEALSTLKKSKSGFLFTNSKGKPLTDNECKWPIKKACSRAGNPTDFLARPSDIRSPVILCRQASASWKCSDTSVMRTSEPRNGMLISTRKSAMLRWKNCRVIAHISHRTWCYFVTMRNHSRKLAEEEGFETI